MGSVKAFVDSLTAGEVAVLVALIGVVPTFLAIVASIFTTRYMVKHGPNYEKKIGDLHTTLDALAKTQEEFRQQQAQSAKDEQERHRATEKRAEDARWKPMTKVFSQVENNEQSNSFILDSSVEFSLKEVSLCTQTGAKVHDFPTNGVNFSSKGFRVAITGDALNKISNNSQTWIQGEYFDALIRYTVVRDGLEYGGEIAIHAQGVLNYPNMGIKLIG